MCKGNEAGVVMGSQNSNEVETMGGEAPLRGIRVADLTIITAGASATQILADFGADVIKVESARWMDPFRRWEGAPDAVKNRPDSWNQSPPFLNVNRNKRSVALDLKQPEGRATFLRLVTVSDVVAQNFRVGVMERLGLGVDELRAVKPDIVTISLSSQGEHGPESGYGSLGSTLDALSGLMSITGYGPDAPMWSGQAVNYPDQAASVFGAALVLMGLRQRDRTGEAVDIDLSQRELVTSMIGEAVLEYTVNGHTRRPNGNRDFSMAPHGVYPCKGADSWVAIAVQNDGQWRDFCRITGREEMAEDARYATFSARWRHLEELDALVTEWTESREPYEVTTLLQQAGISAGAVVAGPGQWDDPNLKHREFFREVVHPLGGAQLQRSWPFRLSPVGGSVYRPAPLLGEQTAEVLSSVLGYSTEEIAHLDELGVTATPQVEETDV